MYTNGINNYNTVKEDKPKISSQNFEFEGESFSEMMDKEQPAGRGLRETAQELAEDESILSTDEENRAMIKRGQNAQENTDNKPQLAQEQDKARLLKLMDMSNKINLANINISKSKKEIETTVGNSVEDNVEREDITSVVAKMAALKDKFGKTESDDIETSVNIDKHTEDFDEDTKRDNSQALHETEEELLEDLSILSTEEENLEMARRNSAMNMLSDDDYKTSEEDMVFLSEIVALNNQMSVEQSDKISNTQNVLNALMSQTQSMDDSNYINMSDLSGEDVDYIIKMLENGTSDASDFTDDNKELAILSEKFLSLLRDSIINKKVFRIDFDNQISVIIKISNDGKINAEFLTNDAAIETYLKNNLHLLKQRFEALNVNYGEVKYKNTEKES